MTVKIYRSRKLILILLPVLSNNDAQYSIPGIIYSILPFRKALMHIYYIIYEVLYILL